MDDLDDLGNHSYALLRTNMHVNQIFSVIVSDIFFYINNDGRQSVVLTDCNTQACPLGGRNVKLFSV